MTSERSDRLPVPASRRSVRAGGHQVAGSGVCDDGLVIDLSAMAAVQVDATARNAHVQAGPRGVTSTGRPDPRTGHHRRRGLRHRGGGPHPRRRTRRVDAHPRPQLRQPPLRRDRHRRRHGADRQPRRPHRPVLGGAGGGRGLGVVTSFEFDLHPLGPEVAGALVLYPYDDAPAVIRAWRQVALDARHRRTRGRAGASRPCPTCPRSHGQPVVLVAGTFVGPAEQADPVLTPLRDLATPLADMSGTVIIESPSGSTSCSPTGVATTGSRTWSMSQRLAHRHARRLRRRPPLAGVGDLHPHPRRRHRPGRPRRDRLPAPLSPVQHQHRRQLARPRARRTTIDWVRSTWERVAPFATGGVYLNFAGFGDEADLGPPPSATTRTASPRSAAPTARRHLRRRRPPPVSDTAYHTEHRWS